MRGCLLDAGGTGLQVLLGLKAKDAGCVVPSTEWGRHISSPHRVAEQHGNERAPQRAPAPP